MDDPGFFESYFLWRDAMFAALVGSILVAHLGVYVVLMRGAFVSAAVSQAAGLGVVSALFLGASAENDLRPLALGVGLGVIASAVFATPRRHSRISPDTVLACVVIAASALTLVLARYLEQDYQHVQGALFGDAVVASESELWLLGGMATLALLLHIKVRHRFLLVAFDPEAARARGMSASRWGLLLGLLVGASISMVTRALGALPAFAFSVIPAGAALLLAQSMRWIFWLSAAIAAASATLGYYLSFVADLPTGPTMVGVAVLMLVPGVLRNAIR